MRSWELNPTHLNHWALLIHKIYILNCVTERAGLVPERGLRGEWMTLVMAGTGEMLWKLRTGAGWLWQGIGSIHPTSTGGSEHRLPKDPLKPKAPSSYVSWKSRDANSELWALLDTALPVAPRNSSCLWVSVSKSIEWVPTLLLQILSGLFFLGALDGIPNPPHGHLGSAWRAPSSSHFTLSLFSPGKHTGLCSVSLSHLQICAWLSWLSPPKPSPTTPPQWTRILQGLKQVSSSQKCPLPPFRVLITSCHHTFNCMFTSFILSATNVLSTYYVPDRQCSELWRTYWWEQTRTLLLWCFLSWGKGR